ncbi:UbiA prenyltransferase family protein [Myceligenerans xiligouense]|uniref:4-hydroxybenzoate polyprenyltransferase n=1 Tax=Myceligenerans xiligouense TaxID=253184 RepID=A0A3N4YKD7_9MICO|nr:UbiA prenyltransferase family protein [Myceligenerans xiligouense]RPF21203.1 4-hydroxybenzoate polyprenyltransferase [Myceligenerans xiligouense]
MDVLTPEIRGPRPPATAATTAREKAADLWRLLRPQQWVKNVFVVPIGMLGVTAWNTAALDLAWALALFIAGSSAVYVVNDIIDRDADRLHPVKRSRPVASGRVPVSAAVVLAVALLAGVGLLMALRPIVDSWPVVAYLLLNVGYSFGLKRIAVLDIAIVAGGFALRYLQGSIAAEGEPSVLLAASVFAACMMFAAGKRRHEIGLADTRHRSALAGYSVPFLDQLIGLAAVTTLLTYALHVNEIFSPGASGVFVLLSAVLVAGLVVRYLQLVLVKRQGGDPSKDIASDRVTIVVGIVTGVCLVVGTVLP